ncbi:DUF2259 domain-containing protein [Roseibium litorale]|uniref:DUF2259 domain-containing protein n=1 Tax=Roseibium litorale TaxID=2803841 RepID=A0ABR9CJ49_9HYPH|nr:DUF2259 domain-containing protein [Roseibium litorale]MBD8890336.1 DUF2259 domain-containing protein [Roseibium litorale]
MPRMPLAALALLTGLGSALPAAAGDFARLDVLGFSADGSRFAFEQYGIEDGSGFPYSEIFVFDVPNDSWVKPSPFRKRDDTDGDRPDMEASLSAVREELRAEAAATLSSSAIAGRGIMAGSNPVTELDADPHQMTVNPRLVVPPIDQPVAISLEEFPLPSGQCASYGADTKGFRLTISSGGNTRILNDDKSLPSSRGCPLTYRIDRVYTHYPEGSGAPVFAVLVQMQTLGFEGPNGRYLAITGTLNN